MDARADPASATADPIGALMELSVAARAISAQPGSHARERLNNAVARVLRLFRLHGLEAAPRMSRAEAVMTFRQALRQALDASVPRPELVAIFNGEEEAGEPARKDLQ